MQAPLPLTRELVLIGGGHTHALVLRRWGMNPLPGTRLTVINPGPTAPYTGMLPGFVAGHYARNDLSIDLIQLARFAGARVILGIANAIDREKRQIHVPGRAPIPYDIASINIGITSAVPDLPGYAEHAVPAKPLGPYAKDWVRFREVVRQGTPPEIAVIGGGVGGIELSLAMAHALRTDGATPQITVLERDTALPGLGPGPRAALLSHMTRLGVSLREHTEAASVSAETVTLADQTEVPSRFTVTVAGARPHDWLADTGLALTDGFLTIDDQLRTSDPAIYAAGDCAHLPDPRPKAGVYAVREAPVLYHNLRADLTGRQRRRYRPQRDYLKLISLGGKSALADKWGMRIEGPRLWRWKDRIDRKFMEKFKDLTPMAPPPPPREAAAGLREALGEKPMCGGCGAKVGGGTLSGVLQTLPMSNRNDILSRPGDDAAILATGDARQVITTDHLRAFTEDPWTLARITAVHALGDIWAMGAAPQAALATVILPRMADAMQGPWLSEIMQAASEVFTDAGAEIVGGHTTLGSELTVGFIVTGLCETDPITLAGARPGDALILTKPIGSGTLLAAEMAIKAQGDHIAKLLTAMAQPQGAASNILSKAHAMTDVTGFGLAGHLMGICDASNVSANLDLDAIPLFDGAEALAAAGIRSTLSPKNRETAARMVLPEGPRADLLFDPQTAGGLLAAVPAKQADTLLKKLMDAGYTAARIGEIQDGPPLITFT